MDGVIDMDGARSLVGNAALWPRVRDFLWDFAPQVHESWLDGQAARWLAGGSPRVKRYILDSLGVEPCFHAFPGEDGSRILLLDAATLGSVARWLGALYCAEPLRKVMDGATVRALKAAFAGVYPEVFGYTAYFKDLVSRGAAEPLGEDVAAEVAAKGYGLLRSALSKLPAPVVSRARFKLHRDLRVSDPQGEIGLPVVLKLLKLKFPEAYSLCCS